MNVADTGCGHTPNGLTFFSGKASDTPVPVPNYIGVVARDNSITTSNTLIGSVGLNFYGDGNALVDAFTVVEHNQVFGFNQGMQVFNAGDCLAYMNNFNIGTGAVTDSAGVIFSANPSNLLLLGNTYSGYSEAIYSSVSSGALPQGPALELPDAVFYMTSTADQAASRTIVLDNSGTADFSFGYAYPISVPHLAIQSSTFTIGAESALSVSLLFDPGVDDHLGLGVHLFTLSLYSGPDVYRTLTVYLTVK